ncbi:MAG: glutamate-ammonia-ligase adenylyltransferase, partial [Candidatus Hydrogenedentes bacterium]|nr:glutamate-ammonia-ligase adenylyltransferase [Candidatus Hydrogenedentota bacterium]
MREEFRAVPFQDPAAAGRRLDAILNEARPRLADDLAAVLAKTANPDVALTRLERFLDAGLTRRTHIDLMEAAPSYADMLLTLLDQSHHLTDILCRNPGYMAWLWEEAELERARSRQELTDDLLDQIRTFDSFEARSQSMRRFKRREILRVAARDIVRHMPLESVTEDLSNLADAAIEAAIESALPDLIARHGAPGLGDTDTPAAFAVLALGKLGGRELNFSSDVDLLFLYSGEGTTAGGASGPVGNDEFFQKLGTRVVKALSEVTDEGRVFRVDMRLRPYGRIGPLAVGLDAALYYYESAGQAWERQALIKARPAAGDLALAQQFIERTRPFVFPRYFDDDTLEDIRQIKQQAEAHVHDKGQTHTEVKLGRGGIRDIEFTVQVLQLLNGGRLEDLRTANTLEAIKALERHAILTPFEADTLAGNYV